MSDSRRTRLTRTLRLASPVLLVALFTLSVPAPAALAQGLPARAAAKAHKARRVRTLPSLPAATVANKPTEPAGNTSPYARAAAARNDAGVPPPGRRPVRPTVPAAADAAAR